MVSRAENRGDIAVREAESANPCGRIGVGRGAGYVSDLGGSLELREIFHVSRIVLHDALPSGIVHAEAELRSRRSVIRREFRVGVSKVYGAGIQRGRVVPIRAVV